jgi:hypothetical protein
MSKTAETNLFSASKKQFYGAEGTGRDSYIYRDNGGFCPMRGPAMVEGIGTYKWFLDLIEQHFHSINA